MRKQARGPEINSVPAIHQFIVNTVVENSRMLFLEEGVDTKILEKLAKLWKQKLLRKNLLANNSDPMAMYQHLFTDDKVKSNTYKKHQNEKKTLQFNPPPENYPLPCGRSMPSLDFDETETFIESVPLTPMLDHNKNIINIKTSDLCKMQFRSNNINRYFDVRNLPFAVVKYNPASKNLIGNTLPLLADSNSMWLSKELLLFNKNKQRFTNINPATNSLSINKLSDDIQLHKKHCSGVASDYNNMDLKGHPKDNRQSILTQVVPHIKECKTILKKEMCHNLQSRVKEEICYNLRSRKIMLKDIKSKKTVCPTNQVKINEHIFTDLQIKEIMQPVTRLRRSQKIKEEKVCDFSSEVQTNKRIFDNLKVNGVKKNSKCLITSHISRKSQQLKKNDKIEINKRITKDSRKHASKTKKGVSDIKSESKLRNSCFKMKADEKNSNKFQTCAEKLKKTYRNRNKQVQPFKISKYENGTFNVKFRLRPRFNGIPVTLNQQNDGSDLNSDDDISDEELNLQSIECENCLTCQFVKISRRKSKWKFELKHCVVNINGKEYFVQQVIGESYF